MKYVVEKAWDKGLRPVLEGFVVPMHEGVCETGGRLNKKDGLTRYGNSHVKDKTS